MSKDTIIKRMLGNSITKNINTISPKDAMIAAVCILRYATLLQIGILFPDYSAGTIRRYVNELVTEKYLNTASVRKPGEIAIYSISRKGINRTFELCGNHFDEEGIIINTDVPELLLKRTHRVFANDLYVHMCSNLNKRFTYQPEQAIDEYGNLLEPEERANKKMVPDGYYDICIFDTISKMPTSYTIYQEQDMGTQKTEAITNKLTQYNKYIFRNASDEPLYRQEICFTINAQKTTKKDNKKYEHNKNIPESALIVIQTLLAIRGDSSYEDFKIFFEGCKNSIKNSIGNRRYSILVHALENLDTINNSSNCLMSSLISNMKNPENVTIPELNTAYISRRNFIRDCIFNMPEYINLIKSGLRITALDNAHMEHTFNISHLFFTDDNEVSSIINNINKFYFPTKTHEFIITPDTINDIVFPYVSQISKPKAPIDNTKKVIIENISEDISGFIRAVSLYGYGLNMPTEHHVLLLSCCIKDCLYFLKRTKGIEYKLITDTDERFIYTSVTGKHTNNTNKTKIELTENSDYEGMNTSDLMINIKKLLAALPGYPVFFINHNQKQEFFIPLRNDEQELFVCKIAALEVS